MNKQIIFSFAAGFLAALLLLNIPWTSEETSEAEPEEEHVKIVALTEDQLENAKLELSNPNVGTILVSTPAQGKIIYDPSSLVHLLAPVNGFVKAAYKNLGDSIEKGELLAIIESTELADTAAAYLDAQGEEELAKTRYEKDQALFDKGIGSELDLLDTKRSFQAAELKRRLYQDKLLTMGVNPDHLTSGESLSILEIRSPLEGVVITRHLTNGEAVLLGEQMYQIANLDKVWVELNISYKDAHHLKPGQHVHVTDSKGKTGRGHLTRISPQVDETTSQVTAVAELLNPQGTWKPGAYVSSKVITSSVDGEIVVPRSALVNLDNELGVYKETAEGFVFQPVVIECQDDSYCLIKEGITPEDKVVIKNSEILKFEMTKRDGDD